MVIFIIAIMVVVVIFIFDGGGGGGGIHQSDDGEEEEVPISIASAIGIGFASLSSRLAMQVQRQFSDGEKRGRKLAESLAAGPILHGTWYPMLIRCRSGDQHQEDSP